MERNYATVTLCFKLFFYIDDCVVGQGVFIFSVVKHEPLVYLDYQYPAWGEGIGGLMAASSVIAIPGYAIYLFIVTPGNWRQVSHVLVRTFSSF